MAVQFKNKQKEGWLHKQSRHLKQWRRRWFILDDSKLYSFKDKENTKQPTEVIDLKVFSSVKSSEDYTGKANSFDVYSPDFVFSMAATSESEKEDWIRAIGRAIVLSHSKTLVDDDGDSEEDNDDDD